MQSTTTWPTCAWSQMLWTLRETVRSPLIWPRYLFKTVREMLIDAVGGGPMDFADALRDVADNFGDIGWISQFDIFGKVAYLMVRPYFSIYSSVSMSPMDSTETNSTLSRSLTLTSRSSQRMRPSSETATISRSQPSTSPTHSIATWMASSLR